MKYEFTIKVWVLFKPVVLKFGWHDFVAFYEIYHKFYAVKQQEIRPPTKRIDALALYNWMFSV